MKKSKLLVSAIITILLVGLFALPAGAQSPVTTEVDRTQLSTDEALVLTITVDTGSGQPSSPVIESLDGFQVINSSSGTQISIVNGSMSSAATYRYTLRPVQAGQLVIGAVSVDINGQTYSTPPITIEVTQGTGQIQPAPNQAMPNMGNFPTIPGFPNLNSLLNSVPSSPSGSTTPLDPAEAPTELAGQDFFIEAQVDNPTPYQGEQVVYTFRFYQAANLFDQPQYQSPSFSGFWSQELVDQQTNHTIEAAGRTYRVTELQTVLFPTVIGELTIEPAKLTIPGDFFSRGQELQTQPIAVNVQPFPANAPGTFQGAVGQFNIQAQTDVAETKVNETVTLNVTISGQGNLDALTDPQWTEGPEWRAFDSEATVDAHFENGAMTGQRSYERLLVPTQASDLVLPAIEFSYFNPANDAYETVSTEPITVHVEGDDSTAVVPTAPVDAAGGVTVQTGSGPAAAALRPNKTASALSHSSSLPLTEKPSYWLLWSVPLLLLAGHFGWQRYRQQRLDTADTRRRNKAARAAQNALRDARKRNQPQEIGKILIGYLEEKRSQRLTGLSQTQLIKLLSDEGIDQDLAERLRSCLMLSEMGRYAPVGSMNAEGSLFTEAEKVIDELERTL